DQKTHHGDTFRLTRRRDRSAYASTASQNLAWRRGRLRKDYRRHLSRAGEHFGISKSELERFFPVQHFQQHYQMITVALATYRSVSDWLAGSSIPDWIRTGVRRL